MSAASGPPDEASPPDPSAPVQDFATFWRALAEQARACGLSKSAWAARASGLAGRRGQSSDLDHRPFSAKTLYDRTANGRRVDWDEAQWFVRAVPGLDAAGWRAAWQRAERRWLDPQDGSEPHGSGAPPVVAAVAALPAAAHPSPHPEWWRRHLRPIAAVACGVLAGLALLVAAPWTNRATPCAHPTSSAASIEHDAHGEFDRGCGRFVLYDDSADGRSAILQTRRDGAVARTTYNSRGKTDAQNPPKEFGAPDFVTGATVEYRVCVGEYGSKVPERSCGSWRVDAP